MTKATLSRFGGKSNSASLARAAIKTALDSTAKLVKTDYQATQRTWKKQKTDPIIANQGEDTRLVYVPNKVFGYVDLGTRPHVIRPKTARRLAFRSGFIAKTSPGVIGSGAGGSFGGYRYAKQVKHPGTKPRLFSKTIASKRVPDLAKAIDNGLKAI